MDRLPPFLSNDIDVDVGLEEQDVVDGRAPKLS